MVDIEQPDQLVAYLKGRGLLETSPRVSALQGGVSNRTVLVEFDSGGGWVLKQALEKLRVAVDWYSSPQRIEREAMGLRWLKTLVPWAAVPDFLFEDTQEHILAMSAVPRPHRNWKFMLLGGFIQAAHLEEFARVLAALHRQAFLRRGEVAALFDDITFFETLRLEPYYRFTASQVKESADFLETLIADTLAERHTLVHGDYSPKNVLVHEGRLFLLDYEVMHWGDPAFDLGFSMTHFLSKAHHLPIYRQQFADATRLYWSTYVANLDELPWKAPLEARAVRHTLGCLLARVAGRSPLEYLTPAQITVQQRVVTALMQDPPNTVDDLMTEFIGALD